MKYDLAKVLEDIKRDERGGDAREGPEKILTQEEIRAMARNRRRKPASDKAPPK